MILCSNFKMKNEIQLIGDGGMDKKELLSCIRFFREKKNTNKLIAFVGAGVSCNVDGMPSWFQLIQKMADEIDYSRCINCKHKKEKCDYDCNFKDEYSQDEFLKIPQYVYNQNPKKYMKIIQENVDEGNAEAPLSDAIFNMRPNHIITTNYDKLIESCKNVQRDNYQVIIQDKDLLESSKNHYIIKMHGDILQPQSIVLKEADYLDYSQKHVLIEMFIKSLLANHIILFLGYSLNDYNIKLIINWINFIRTQSNVLEDADPIGYIVLDNESVSDTEIKYFENNNIKVVNIRNMPLVENIPNQLTNDMGKRLYSFLNTISDASCEKYLGQELLYDDIVTFLNDFAFVNSKFICESLYIRRYSIKGYQLKLHSVENYEVLVKYLKSKTKCAITLSKLLINAGIKKIVSVSTSKPDIGDEYIIDEMKLSLLENEYYQLYVCNEYEKLADKCNNSLENDWKESSFYMSLIYGKNKFSINRYEENKDKIISDDEKVAYLFNYAVVKAWKTYQFSSSNVSQYIEGMPNRQKQEGYKFYIDMFNGNSQLLLKMNESLSKLKEQYENNYSFVGCSSLEELYEIKRLALEQYMIHFCNNLIFVGFSDLKKVLKIYAEAIICTNEEHEEIEDNFLGIKSKKEKYSIDIIDLDILTKMLSIKELSDLMEEYHIVNLKVNEGVSDEIVKCFCNLTISIKDIKLFSSFFNASSEWINLAICLTHIELTDVQKKRVSEYLILLMQDKDFLNYLFSIDFPEWRKSAKVILELFRSVKMPSDIKILERFLSNPKLYEYICNSNIKILQEIVFVLAGENLLIDEQNRMNEIINKFPEGEKKKIIQLFMRIITDKDIKENLIQYIVEHFDNLNSNEICDFVFSGWIELTEEQKDYILENALKIQESRTPGMRSFPDPLERQLELIYILYISDIIKDISKIKSLASESDFLKFFYDDETFDYSKIDFSNYMWQNIARCDKFRGKFKLHKDEIIPHIERKIEMNTATEFERKLLYGVLLDKVF